MGTLITLLIVIGSIFAYTTVAGATGITFYRQRMKACSGCSQGYGCYDDHDAAAVFAGAAWPFLLPLVVGIFIADRPVREQRKAKAMAKEIERLEKELGIQDRRQL